jgi:hypothetical protein
VKLVVLLALAFSLAQVFPSCGGGSGEIQVIGWVESKRIDRTDNTFILVINGHDYPVPDAFWRRVEVGDLVKYDGITWSIVRKAGATPTPAATPKPTPTATSTG